MHAVNGDGHDDNDKNVSLADDDDGDMILSRCLTVQKAVQYEYIAKFKCVSFNISTEEGDYHVATELGHRARSVSRDWHWERKEEEEREVGEKQGV